MDWQNFLISVIPFIILALVFILMYTRAGSRKVVVYLISAVKPEHSDNIEMHVSTDLAEIDEWEKTFRSRGYHVSRRTDEIQVKIFERNIKQNRGM